MPRDDDEDFLLESQKVELSSGPCLHRFRETPDGMLQCSACGLRTPHKKHESMVEEKKIKRKRARDPGGYTTREERRSDLLRWILDSFWRR